MIVNIVREIVWRCLLKFKKTDVQKMFSGLENSSLVHN